jgi:hypothetical protein
MITQLPHRETRPRPVSKPSRRPDGTGPLPDPATAGSNGNKGHYQLTARAFRQLNRSVTPYSW